jgi:hypothetical protein
VEPILKNKKRGIIKAKMTGSSMEAIAKSAEFYCAASN